MQFYSDKVEKLFKTKEELDEAEKKFDAEQEEKLALKVQRKEDAEIVETAWKKYEDAQKLANDAYITYKDELTKFIEKHGGYHKTLTSPTTLFDFFFDHFLF